MSTLNITDLPSDLVADALALADAHSEGFEKRCRRWRRRASVRRGVDMVLLAMAILFLAGSALAALAQGPYAIGALPTAEAAENVSQMLINQ